MGAVIKAAWAVHLVHVSGLCRGRARAVRVPSAAARPDRRSVPCWRHSWWGRRGLVEALRGTAVRGGNLPGHGLWAGRAGGPGWGHRTRPAAL